MKNALKQFLIVAPFAVGLPSADALAGSCNHLEMRLMQLQGGGASAGEIRNAKRMLADRGCRGGVKRTRANRSAERRGIVFRYSAGDRRQPLRNERRDRIREAGSNIDRMPARSLPAKTYRTLCVRKCDGYYFPISFSTTRKRFGDDARMCQARCPGADAQLFVHDARTGRPEGMVSAVDGAPYAQLSNAFVYRSVYKRDCTCGQPLSTAEIRIASKEGQTGITSPGALSLPHTSVDDANSIEDIIAADGDYATGADPAVSNAGGLDTATELEPVKSVRMILPPPGWSDELSPAADTTL